MEKNKDYFIIDTFISKEEEDKLEESLLSSKMDWHLNLGTVPKKLHAEQIRVFPNIFEYIQFTHLFISYNKNTGKSEINSKSLNLISNILDSISKFFKCTIDIVKAKVNLQTKIYLSNSHDHNTPHIDLSVTGDNYWTMVYFVIDSDGPLRIFDSENNIVEYFEPKKGRAVFLKNHIKHCGVHPTKNDLRCVLNINFTTILPENLDK
jgi:hypothetical protein